MKEALKLALDLAIMHHSDDGYAELRSKVRQLAKEALAQPVQEPVAWGFRHHDGAIYDCISPEAHADCEGEYNVPLYDAPPKRPWVGLTDDEVFGLFGSFITMTGKSWRDLYRMSEAKLKEKNT